MLAFSLLVTSAAADPAADSERARSLFRDGRKLASESKWEDACKKFEESLKLDVGVGTKFNLADCYEHTNRPQSAKKLFLEVADRSHEAGQTERETAARARAAALDPAIPKIVIDVMKDVPEKLEIRRDGVPVEPSAWGGPQPVDPGKHEIVVTAPGKKPWSTEVDAEILKTDTTVAVPALEAAGDAAVEKPTENSDKAESKPEPKEAAEPPPKSENDTVPILLYSAGGAGVILAATSFIFYKRSNDEAKAICPTSHGCDLPSARRHEDLVGDAELARGLGYVGLGIVGAAAITGGIFMLYGPHGKEREHAGSFSAAPLVARDGGGAVVQGRF
jgi:hypothetical protein